MLLRRPLGLTPGAARPAWPSKRTAPMSREDHAPSSDPGTCDREPWRARCTRSGFQQTWCLDRNAAGIPIADCHRRCIGAFGHAPISAPGIRPLGSRHTQPSPRQTEPGLRQRCLPKFVRKRPCAWRWKPNLCRHSRRYARAQATSDGPLMPLPIRSPQVTLEHLQGT